MNGETTYISEAAALALEQELNDSDDDWGYVSVLNGNRSYVAVYDGETGEYLGNL